MVVNEDGLITENQNTLDDVQIDIDSIDNEVIENTEDSTIEVSDSDNNHQPVVALKSTEEETANTTCLALTVRKSYNLAIVKNSIFTTLRVSWKVALTTFVLNILKLFF